MIDSRQSTVPHMYYFHLGLPFLPWITRGLHGRGHDQTTKVNMKGRPSICMTLSVAPPPDSLLHKCKFGFCAGTAIRCMEDAEILEGMPLLLFHYWIFGFHRIRLFDACRDMMQRLHLKWRWCLQDRTRIRKGRRDRKGLSARRDEEKLDSHFSSRQAWQGDRDGTKIVWNSTAMDRLNAQIYRFEHGRIYPLQDMTTINHWRRVIIKKWQGLSMDQKRPVQGPAGIVFSVNWGWAMACAELGVIPMMYFLL